MSSFSTAIRVRKWLVIWASLFSFALLAACSFQSPESVTKDFINAAAANHVEEAVGYFSLKDVKENDLTVVKGKMQMMVGGLYSEIQRNGGLDSVSTTLVSKEADKATVSMTLKFKNGKSKEENWKLIQESGTWKILVN